PRLQPGTNEPGHARGHGGLPLLVCQSVYPFAAIFDLFCMPLAVTIIRRGLVSSTTCAIRKPMRLIQFLDPHGRVRLGRVDGAGTAVAVMSRPSSTYELALAAVAGGVTLENLLSSESWDADAP